MAELHYSLVRIDQEWCAVVTGAPPRCFHDREAAFSKVAVLVSAAIACGHAADLTIQEPADRDGASAPAAPRR